MVLHSQVSRTNKISSRVTVRSRRKSKRRLLTIFILLAAVTWLCWPGNNEGDGTANDGFASQPNLGQQPGDHANDKKQNGTRSNTAPGSQQASLFGPFRNSTTIIPAPSTSTDTQPGNSNSASANNNVPVFETPGPGSNNNAATLPVDNNSKTHVTGTTSNPKGGEPPIVIKDAPTLGDLIPNLSQLLKQVSFTSTGDAKSELRRGMQLIEVGKFIEGRSVLSNVLITGGGQLSKLDGQAIRDTLASVNKSLVFSNRVLENDPLIERFTVKSGDRLGAIGRKYGVTYQLLEQINNVKATRIQIGQKLKAIKGPFHAVVEKSSYRMDMYLKDQAGSLIYIRSFWVGLGKDDGTPEGTWVCKAGGKLSNPSWRHPRTNEYFAANDPKNPIGDYWIALQGTDANTKGRSGYGIHGTIEPESIGKQMSLGCVRMLPADIKLAFKLLADGKSTVTIRR